MKTMEERAFDLLESTGLNWSVEKENLRGIDSQRLTDSYGLFRKDSGYWLGTVGSDYTIMQNAELALILEHAIEGLNIDLTRGGQLKGGQRVYLQAQLSDEFIGNSNIKRMITVLNSHSKASLAFGSTNTVVVCNNTFMRAFHELQKFRHTATLKQKIEIAQAELKKTIELDVALMTSYKKMADLPLQDEAIELVLDNLFDVKKDTPTTEISTQKENRIVDFSDALNQSIIEQGSTVWALFNGITRFVNHITAPADIIKKMDYIMLQGGAQFMNKGYDLLKKYTDDKTPEIHFMEANN